jgi:benzoate transport
MSTTSPNISDPREILNQSAMTRLQIFVVSITVALNALDGFDLLAISFASPGITSEWGIDKVALGVVLSMEFVGMGIGSLTLGGFADKIGRRPTILICLTLMTIGMFAATTAGNVIELSIWRVLTGFGIGGMLAAVNALATEFSNLKVRYLSVSLMAIGYPIGGVVGGMMARNLLAAHDWRSVFYLGGCITAFFIPLFYFMVPESPLWLTLKQPKNALQKINKALARMGHQTIAMLPTVSESTSNASIKDIFSPKLIKATILVTLVYFLHVMTFYFILKWLPKIVADMGYSAASSAGVLVWANVGGLLGGTVFGLLTLRFKLKPLMLSILLFSVIFVILFGQTSVDLSRISLLAAMASFFTNAGMVGIYTLFAQAFPTHTRAFGTGFAIGIGRSGAILSPILVGLFFNSGLGLSTVAIIMATGSLLALAALLLLKSNAENDS